MIKRIFCGLAAALAFNAALAIPAKPTPVVFTQPDGTEIKVNIRGDEHHHFYLSEDGYLLVNVDDAFYYGNVDANGSIVASKIMAKPVGKRLDADRQFLRNVDMNRVFTSLDNAKMRKIQKRTPNVGLDEGFQYPAKGNAKGLAVLVEYKDKKFTMSEPYPFFDRMLNEKGFSDYGATGSARDYFNASSNGIFDPDFDVYGPVTLAHNMSYYGGNDSSGNDKNAEKMVIEACQILDGEVDFSQYDCDGDGYIDYVYVFYAGQGEASGGGANTVWPHSWMITEASDIPYFFDGVRLDKYACSNEWEGSPSSGAPHGIGAFCHEFSHVLGLPDLYSTNYSSNAFTPGEWSVLDYGPYNNDSRTPPLYSIFERNALGWAEPIEINGPMSAELHPVSQNVGFVIETSKANEFFLLENRQKYGWDEYLPGHGMLIWHIDYNKTVWKQNAVNNNYAHQYVDLEEADNDCNEDDRSGDSFPGSANITSFTAETVPGLFTWNKKGLNLPITNIQEIDGIITFDVCGGGDLVVAAGEEFPYPDVLGFAEMEVEALDASSVSDESFVANWSEVPSAKKYVLNIYTRGEDGSIAEADYSLGSFIFRRGKVSVAVSGLEKGTEYFYTVYAVNGIYTTKTSNEINVTTTSESGSVSDMVVDGAINICKGEIIATIAVDVFSADGRLVYSNARGNLPLNKGLYIVKPRAGKAIKAYID